MSNEHGFTTAMSEFFEKLIESAAARYLSMGGGFVTSAVGWIKTAEGIATLGLFISLAGFIMNWVFQIRRDKRDALVHAAKMKALQEGRIKIE